MQTSVDTLDCFSLLPQSQECSSQVPVWHKHPRVETNEIHDNYYRCNCFVLLTSHEGVYVWSNWSRMITQAPHLRKLPPLSHVAISPIQHNQSSKQYSSGAVDTVCGGRSYITVLLLYVHRANAPRPQDGSGNSIIQYRIIPLLMGTP